MAKITDFDEKEESQDEPAQSKKGKKGIKVNKEPKEKKEQKPIKLPFIIGIIAGAVRLLVILGRFVFFPMIVHGVTAGSKDSQKKYSSQKRGEFDGLDEKLAQLTSSGRITTNPRSSAQFVVVDLGITFIPKNEDVLKELKESKGKESKDLNESSLPPKLLARTKGVVNSVLGSFTVEELHIIRDSLPEIFRRNLKPVFREKDLYVKEVILQE